MISKREAFGLVYAEALTQGLPIIYTKNQGFDKQFEEGYVGYHVESSDIDEIIQCIKTIISNYKDLSERAEKASQRFSWAEIVKKYVVIYNDLD